jgi:hypothetical protein
MLEPDVMVNVALPPALLLLVSTVSGCALKLADIYSERRLNATSYAVAGATAILFGLLIADNPASSTLILGIMIGVTLAAKVNRMSLIFGGVVTLLVAGALGISTPIVWMLGVVAALTWVDEIGHEVFGSDVRVPARFFRWRLALKLGVFVLTATRWLDVSYTLSFYGFDFAYDVTGWYLARGGEKVIAAARGREGGS